VMKFSTRFHFASSGISSLADGWNPGFSKSLPTDERRSKRGFPLALELSFNSQIFRFRGISLSRGYRQREKRMSLGDKRKGWVAHPVRVWIEASCWLESRVWSKRTF